MVITANNSAIDQFVKKYKIAIASKSKDIRLTVEEASDLISAIATVANAANLDEANQKLNLILKKIDKLSIVDNTNTAIDGGGFKN